MRIRHIVLERFRSFEQLRLTPGARAVILGPNNSGKSTILEALDLLLSPGAGRLRPALTDLDYFDRDTTQGFTIEAVVGDLPAAFKAEVAPHLEGWVAERSELTPETDGPGIEPVVRLRARGTPDLDLLHEFAKPESEGQRCGPGVRAHLTWIFDGRARDPARQLQFYQGGVLDRLFSVANMDAAVTALRDGLAGSSHSVNEDAEVAAQLNGLAEDLRVLGVIGESDAPSFEVGSLSRRDLLQALRLSLPVGRVEVPLSRHGRGIQRLVLLAALLRVASRSGDKPIAAFEEPEEALEPLRQAQVASMLRQLTDNGGQVLAVTHSPEIARSFSIDEFIVLGPNSDGSRCRVLREHLTPPQRQTFERWQDGAIVRGMFARYPVLVEGPSDTAVLQVFWNALVRTRRIRPAAELGLQFINSEGVGNMPKLAAVLDTAGRWVVGWPELDTDEARASAARLEGENHCSVILQYDAANAENLERALVASASVGALGTAMQRIAEDRGYTWTQQQRCLEGHCSPLGESALSVLQRSSCVSDVFRQLPEADAKRVALAAIGTKSVTPFEMKGGRQGRLFSETVVSVDGVAPLFAAVLERLQELLLLGPRRGSRVSMSECARAPRS